MYGVIAYFKKCAVGKWQLVAVAALAVKHRGSSIESMSKTEMSFFAFFICILLKTGV